uniref:2'-deoxynucleoside 5'-phosphate N-hydrolase 1 n=1 Tax=Suricata suricatta TaxID=37032 RepID=A0A673T5T4_SURSU
MAAAETGARERGETTQPGQAGSRALYFCGSIRGGREDSALYGRIVSRLRRFGTVLTEHVAAADLDARGEEASGGDRLIHERDLAWLQQADGEQSPLLPTNSSGLLDPLDVPAVCPHLGLPRGPFSPHPDSCHFSLTSPRYQDLASSFFPVVVAEVTQPSLGVGYELGRAVALNKRILCLFRPQSGRVLSAMIRGAADGSRFQVLDYEEGQVEAMLDQYFEANLPLAGGCHP